MTTMLLRSSSSPILNSLLPHSKDSSPDPEILHHITLSVSMKRMTRVLSDTDLSKHWAAAPSRTASLRPALFSFYELDEDEGGVGVGGGGGWNRNGGGGGGSGFWDSNHGNDGTDVYYRTMIQANPGNPLFLSNYARYLKEVRADYDKAEVYCGRAILANPNDGNVLSMYADLIWESHKDASRAQSYFEQAVKAAPDDCYVLASYAHFLWDADGVVEEDSSEKSPSFFHGTGPPPPPPLSAAA